MSFKVVLWRAKDSIDCKLNLSKVNEVLSKTFNTTYEPEIDTFDRLNLEMDGILFTVYSSGRVMVTGRCMASESELNNARKLCRQLMKTIKAISESQNIKA